MKRLATAVLLAALPLALGSLAACTKSGNGAVVVTTDQSTVVTTITRPAPSPTFKPAAPSTVAPLPPDAAPAKGEVEQACPYILSSQNQGPVSMADLEGDRVYRTTVLTSLKPVGCRFYFWSGPFEAIAEIAPQTFASAQAARDAMILTAKVDPAAQGYPQLLRGVDAISYRTEFFGPDGTRDWACAFTKGNVMVVIRTQRSDTSLNARLIAQAIAPKF